jgi:hypothetical protein
MIRTIKTVVDIWYNCSGDPPPYHVDINVVNLPPP